MLAAESFTAAVAPARCHVGRGVRPTAVAASSSKRMTSVPTKVRGRRVVRARAVETASTTEQEVDQDDEGNAVPLETVSDKGSNPESFPKTPSSANENTFVRSIARQGRGDTNGVTLNDLLATHTGGPPRFFSPIRDDFRSVKGHASKGSVKEYVSDDYVKAIVSKPTLLYVPGLDGTGFAASSQFASLHEDFNVSCLNVPVNDRADFSTLVQVVVQYLEGIKNPEGEGKNPEGAAGFEPRTRRTGTDATGGNRVVYLLGESMGGLVALGVAQQRPDLVDKLVLVNPGSSFDRSVWPLLGPWLPSLPEDVYKAVPYVLAPVLFDPPKLLEGALKAAAAGAVGALNSTTNATTDPLQTPAGVAAALAELANLFPALGQLSSIIPRNTLAHRLKILEEGCASVNAVGALERFGDMEDMESSNKSSPTKRQTIKTLVLVSTNDNLIPSADEGTRLMKRMPPGSCVVQTLQGASHAALQEAGVDLTAVMRESGFAPRRPSDTPSMSNDPKFTPPCAKDLRAAFEGLDTLRSVVSPVFFSTREDGKYFAFTTFRRLIAHTRLTLFFLQSGTVIPGLGAVPFDGNGTHRRPVLLVGNHQTVAPDLPFILERFIVDRNVLPRGLAHPVVMGGGRARGRSGADDILEKKKGEDQRKKDGTEAVKLPDFFGVPPPPGLQSLVTTAQRAVEATLRDGAGAGARGQPLTEAARQFGGGDGPTGISQFSKFGAVPVSGRNLYKLLNNGECILLFPGGVREAFKRKNERYQVRPWGLSQIQERCFCLLNTPTDVFRSQPRSCSGPRNRSSFAWPRDTTR
tara:strand:+ start:204 stop:2621 length:2418 start_codon:yes stop_codon:yes gene_type:complete